MSSYVVNCLPGIENKRYLELGIYNGANFSVVKSTDKVSVDSQFPALFQMTTDEYFSQLSSKEKFDVVYIDACHQRENVVRDFNNVLKHLNSDGIIFVHDLIPDTEELTAAWYCGDGFKVLAHILKNQPNDFEIYSLDSDYGLTVFVNPKKEITLKDSDATVSYLDFKALLSGYRLYSRQELQALVGGIGRETKEIKSTQVQKDSIGEKESSFVESEITITESADISIEQADVARPEPKPEFKKGRRKKNK